MKQLFQKKIVLQICIFNSAKILIENENYELLPFFRAHVCEFIEVLIEDKVNRSY